MIKIVIIDDEKHGIITLQKELSGIDGIIISGTTQDSTQAKSLIEELQPDLVFLDIEMPILNGFQVLDQFDNIPFKVVITTAYNHFAIKAFKYNALDYLLKPISNDDLRLCMDNYMKNQLHTTPSQLWQLKESNAQKVPQTIALSTLQGLSFVKIAHIAYLQADTCYTHIIMMDGQKHLVSKSLANFDFMVEDHPSFFKAHKSYVINLEAITRYIRGEGGEIIMNDHTSIPLSRNKKQEFLSLFHKI